MIILNPKEQKHLLTILHNTHVINENEIAGKLLKKIKKQIEEQKIIFMEKAKTTNNKSFIKIELDQHTTFKEAQKIMEEAEKIKHPSINNIKIEL